MAKSSGSGVIVGRFQVPVINRAHERLIRKVQQKHEKIYLVLCSNPAPSLSNPLDWEIRKALFEEKYGDSIPIIEMPDLPDDRIWSQELDRRIIALRPPRPVVLYGTRERFVSLYSGQFPAEPLEAPPIEIMQNTKLPRFTSLEDFCTGIFYATLRRYPTVYPTVDIALFSPDYRRVLLARKPNETGLRFPGGFADPEEDASFEDAAVRELEEECGPIEIEELTYLGSCVIDDWRYRYAPDAVISHLYACVMQGGEIEPGDDIVDASWYDMSQIQEEDIIPAHQPLFEMVVSYWEERMEALGGQDLSH